MDAPKPVFAADLLSATFGIPTKLRGPIIATMGPLMDAARHNDWSSTTRHRTALPRHVHLDRWTGRQAQADTAHLPRSWSTNYRDDGARGGVQIHSG